MFPLHAHRRLLTVQFLPRSEVIHLGLPALPDVLGDEAGVEGVPRERGQLRIGQAELAAHGL